MNLVWAGALVVGVTAVAVSAMLLVRRRAPEGSYFEDGVRALQCSAVIATGFAVLIGFVDFLAFESYDTSCNGAEAERTVAQQFDTAQFMPASVRQQVKPRSATEHTAFDRWFSTSDPTVRTRAPTGCTAGSLPAVGPA
jgi:hypothetical protein